MRSPGLTKARADELVVAHCSSARFARLNALVVAASPSRKLTTMPRVDARDGE
jgi:hypothetical protein